MFIRKNFPQKLGLAIVIAAALAFLILAANPTTFHIGAWILAAAALVDALIFVFVGKITVCYRCRANIPGPLNADHNPFDLATAEKYRSAQR
jgi:hypothetical protein